MLGCQSSEKVQKFKFGKKVWILTEIVRQFQKFRKNYVKFEFLSQKNPVFGSKSLEKVWKSWEKLGKVWKSSEKFRNRVFRMFGNFGNSSIPKFPKITKK